MYDELGPPMQKGRIRAVSEDRRRLYLDFPNGLTGTVDRAERWDWPVGSVVLVRPEDDHIELAPTELWPEETWIGVVRLRLEDSDGPDWMAGGTYMVTRRVRTLLDVRDATTVEGQEAAVGRSKASGAPLGQRREHDTPNFKAVGDGRPTIPHDAHIRLAAPETNGGVRLLRRSYNYDDGVDPGTGQLDIGLAVHQLPARPPHPIRRAATQARRPRCALPPPAAHGGGVFACPPGC
jgi:Dyp-type peroxidase family